MSLFAAIVCMWATFTVGFALGAAWHSMFEKE
jgi:hypothetical protein